MPPLAFDGSPEDLARLLAALAAAGPLLRPGGAAEGSEGTAGSSGPGAGSSLLLISVPGVGVVGAALPPDGQGPLQAPFGALPAELRSAEEQGGSGAMGPAMQAAMEHVMRVVMERELHEQQPSVPPANESMRDALPRVVVTKEDQLDHINSKCAVCFEEYKAGMRATRMFCGHLFCTNCIREWLRSANSCPICRFELATDSREYEEGRVQRMRGRTARLRGGELRMMRVPELKRLMRALGVSGEGCVEKSDLIRQLGAAPGVELMQDRKDIFYDERELQSLEMPHLRSLMERHCMKQPTGDMDEEEERAAALSRFAAGGWIGTAKKRPPSGDRACGPKSPSDLDVSVDQPSVAKATEAPGGAGSCCLGESREGAAKTAAGAPGGTGSCCPGESRQGAVETAGSSSAGEQLRAEAAVSCRSSQGAACSSAGVCSSASSSGHAKPGSHSSASSGAMAEAGQLPDAPVDPSLAGRGAVEAAAGLAAPPRRSASTSRRRGPAVATAEAGAGQGSPGRAEASAARRLSREH
mmetsp:Transcript_101370/g.307627  ORF Transcript_101370/g.307627 Transcript_101370/m.307627 type:complete len:527 (-) Transcript_101370:20-1600(-)